MASLLSNLVNNLSEGIHRIKCANTDMVTKNVKLAELTISIMTVFLNIYMNFKMQNLNFYVEAKIISQSLMKNLRNNF